MVLQVVVLLQLVVVLSRSRIRASRMRLLTTNKELAPDVLGKLLIKLPLPRAFMLTLWSNDQAFIDKYLADTPGYYSTGDAGIIDASG